MYNEKKKKKDIEFLFYCEIGSLKSLFLTNIID